MHIKGESKSTDDIQKNKVALLFEDVTISDWNAGNKTLLLQKSTVDAVNLYCSSSPSQCSLNFWNDSRKFTTKNAGLAESPKQEKNDVSIQLFVTLPDGSDTQQDSHSVVPGTTLKKIVQDFKHNISSVVGVEIKSVTLNTKSGGRSDNKLNYIMIPISFSVLVILCVVACCLHCSSEKKRKAIDTERRKQAMKTLREDISKSPKASHKEERLPAESTVQGDISTTVTQGDTRRKKRKNPKTGEVYPNSDQQEQVENNESRDLTRKRKKRVKQSRENTSTLTPAVTSRQLEEDERERVPTPMPVHSGQSIRTDPEESVHDGRRHKKKKKHKRSHHEVKEQDEGFAEGSETRQAGNSEDSLIKSLPRPRQLIPLLQRSQATLQV